MFLSKSNFAKLAGVSAMSITKACSKGRMPLAPALFGKKIDPEHPAAVEYLEKVAKKKHQSESSSVTRKKTPAAGKSSKQQQSARKSSIKQDKGFNSKNSPRESSSLKKSTVVRSSGDKADEIGMHNFSYSMQQLWDEVSKHEKEHDQFNAAREFIKRVMIRDLPTDIREMSQLSLDQLVSIFGTDKEFKTWLESLKKIEEIHEKKIKNAETLGELISRKLIMSSFVSHIDGAFRSLLSDAPKSIERDMRNAFKKNSSPEQCTMKIEKAMSKFIKMAKGRLGNGLKRINGK